MKNLKYFINLLLISFTVVSFPLKAAELTCTNGDVTGLGAADYCYTEPTYYGITAYEMGVCTTNPAAPTTASTFDTSTCEVVFQSTAGSLVEVQNGVTSPLTGTVSRPPNGTYTYGYMRLNNTFLIKGSVDFGAAHGVISNRYCTSPTATTDNETGATGTCSATAGATPGTVSTELTDFSGGDSSNLTSYTVGNLTAYLLDSNQFLATAAETTQAGAEGLLGIQQFTSAITISDDTVSMDASLKVSQGMTISVLGANSVGFDSGPFEVVMTVK